jgi:small subunit ribosomal protein S1
MKQGSIVSGVVLDVDKDWVTVHVGLKSEGIISLDEFRDNDGNVDINVGDDVEVALEAVEDGYGETRISREKARKISTWKMLEDALESGEFVTGKIHNRVKGGFAVEVEVVKAFESASFNLSLKAMILSNPSCINLPVLNTPKSLCMIFFISDLI